jgi:hypothetical protein
MPVTVGAGGRADGVRRVRRLQFGLVRGLLCFREVLSRLLFHGRHESCCCAGCLAAPAWNWFSVSAKVARGWFADTEKSRWGTVKLVGAALDSACYYWVEPTETTEVTTMTDTCIPADRILRTEAARRAHVGATTMSRWIEKGLIAGYRLGGRIYVSAGDLDALLAGSQIEPRQMSTRNIKGDNAVSDESTYRPITRKPGDSAPLRAARFGLVLDAERR